MKKLLLTFAIACGSLGLLISLVDAGVSDTIDNTLVASLSEFLREPTYKVFSVFGLWGVADAVLCSAVEIALNTALCALAGALLAIPVHLFPFDGNMSRIRKASVVLSVPVLLMSVLWLATYCYPPFGLSERLYPYCLALYYLSWAGVGLAAILFVRARRSRATVICLAVNGLGAALNLVGPGLIMSRAIPYIRF